MAEGQESGSPFVVPKLCIKRVPVPPTTPSPRKLKVSTAAVAASPAVKVTETSTPAHRPDQPSASGGIKLVLRVPKESELPASGSTIDTSEENTEDGQSSERDSEASKDGQNGESESVKLSSFLRAAAARAADDLEADEPESTASTPPGAGDDTNANDSAASPKRRRKRKRFRLSVQPQKTKSKLWKEASESARPESPMASTQRTKRNEPKKKDVKKEDPSTEENAAPLDVPGSALEAAAIEQEPRFPSPPPHVVATFSPLQLLLDHLLRGFLKKDPERYFAYPVTEDIAPNYSSIISQPMDFSTIRKKVDANEYKNLRQFKGDIDLISTNAMTYNQKNTIYHLAAKKLQNVAEYMFSKEKMNAARKMIPQLSKLTPEEFCVSKAELEKQAEAKKVKLGYYSCIVDDMSPEEVVEQARSAAEAARKKLKAKHPKIQVTFADDRSTDATTTLQMLTPEHVFNKDLGNADEKNRPVVLGDLVPKLKEGTPGLPMPDDKKDLVVPVTYLNSGPFSSFAPYYDSTWATLNKEESDLLLATFGGDEHCVRYVDSIRSFVHGTTDHLTTVVEDVINGIVNGESPAAENDAGQTAASHVLAAEVAYAALSSLNPDPEDEMVIIDNSGRNESADSNQATLDQNAILLRELQTLQNQRLSAQPTFVLTHAPGPSEAEVEAANKAVYNIAQIVAQAAPAQLVSTETVRQVIQGQTGEEQGSRLCDEHDMDILREFLDV